MPANRNGPFSPWVLGCLCLALAGGWWGGASAKRAAADDATADRRGKIEAMSPDEREELAERRRRFSQLPGEEQSRLRELAAAIASDPEAAKLQDVMQRYYEWLKALPPFQQAELKKLSPGERIAKIKSLREEQAKRDAEGVGPGNVFGPPFNRWRDQGPGQYSVPLTPADVEAMFGWLDGYIQKKGPALFEKLPPEKRNEWQKKLAEVRDPLQRNEQLGMWWFRWQLLQPQKDPLEESDLNDLRSKLSPTTRSRLEALPQADQRRWVRGVLPMCMFWQYMARRSGGPPPSFKAEDLSEFFANRLSAAERDWLLKQPGERMQYELLQMYLRWKYRGVMPGPGKPPDWGGRGPGRGDRNGKGRDKGPGKGPGKTPDLDFPPEGKLVPEPDAKAPAEKKDAAPAANRSKTS